jgi:hypothetical protein
MTTKVSWHWSKNRFVVYVAYSATADNGLTGFNLHFRPKADHRHITFVARQRTFKEIAIAALVN